MAQTQFQLEQRLQSCYVTKDLLERLEDHLLDRAVEFTGVDRGQVGKRYSVSIVDNLGDEGLASVRDFPAPLFPDSTQEIALTVKVYDWESPTRQELRIAIRFTRDEPRSRLSIAATADNAREKVAGLSEGLRRILDPCANVNRLFHPPLAVQMLLGGLTTSSAYLAFLLALARLGVVSYQGSQRIGYLGLLVACSMAGYYLVKWWRPLIAFDSRGAQQARKQADWLLYGWLGFVLFGTVFAFIRGGGLGF